MRALIVEDDALVRHLIARVIAGRGHEVTAVSSADDALAAHTKEPFPLVVIDWVLPVGDGLQLCRRIREMEGGDLPVILVVTARNKAADRDLALEAGASDYLAKPVDPATLQTRLVVAERSVEMAARRQEAINKLKESEARQRAIVEGAVDGIITYDRYGGIVSLNPAASALFGLSEEQARGQPIARLLPDAGNELRAIDPDSGPLVGRRRRATEMIAVDHDGQRFPVEVSVSEVQLENRELFTVFVRDLRERKEIESKLMLADRMATVGTLAAGIAHEINNPLAYVVANLGVMAEDFVELGVGEHQSGSARFVQRCAESLAEAQEGADRVRDIVRDLKIFSRPDDRKHGPVDLHAVLESALSMAAKEIRHRARVVRKLDPDLPPALANEARLGQVFLNLLVNAAQAIGDDGGGDHEISVRTGRYSSNAGGPRILVEVKDTGCGIPEELQPRIFDPFFTSKPVGVGTGLGLSICHSIVTQLGGEIEIQSALGEGTLARVILPACVADGDPAPPRARQVKADPGQSARILVVDDERYVARAVVRALRNHDVTVAKDGRDALERLGSERFDVVFCDLIMPEFSGMDIFERVQSDLPAVADRFVFMTGGAYTREAQRFLTEVENRWIEKPFVAAELQEVVREHLAG